MSQHLVSQMNRLSAIIDWIFDYLWVLVPIAYLISSGADIISEFKDEYQKQKAKEKAKESQQSETPKNNDSSFSERVKQWLETVNTETNESEQDNDESHQKETSDESHTSELAQESVVESLSSPNDVDSLDDRINQFNQELATTFENMETYQPIHTESQVNRSNKEKRSVVGYDNREDIRKAILAKEILERPHQIKRVSIKNK